MRYLVNIVLIIVVGFCASSVLRAQTDADVMLYVLTDPRPDTATFDIWLKRTSLRWEHWANGTFRIDVSDLMMTGGLNPAVHTVRLMPGTTGLAPLVAYNPAGMDGYAIVPRIMNGRVSVIVHGPDSVGNAFRLTRLGDSIRIGRFELASTNGSFLSDSLIAFTQPEPYFQANAFKLDHDSITGSGTQRNVWYATHDNVEMNSRWHSAPPPPDTCNNKAVLAGQYDGDLTVGLSFKTEDEHCFRGYYIERAFVDRRDPTTLTFQSRPSLTYLSDGRFLSCVCLTGRTHGNFTDVVEYRRETYAYRLVGVDVRDTATVAYLDTIFVRVPNAIISNAALLENPFKDRTIVQFNADDRLRLTASAYDLGGKLIGYLLDEQGNPIVDKEYPKGVFYKARFEASAVASQGLYNLVLVATPYDDTALGESSRAILKAQLLR